MSARKNPAHALLSISLEFEYALSSVGSGEERPAIQALRRLGQLEEVAQESFKRYSPGKSVTASSSAISSPLPTAPKRSLQTTTSRREYRPALGDPSLIDALMKFGDSIPALQQAKVHQPAAPAPSPRSTAPEEGFAHPRVNRVAAKDLAPRFPLAPSSNLLRPKPQ